MKRIIVSLLSCILFASLSYAQFLAPEVILKREGYELKGSLLCPPVKHAVPLVIIVSGSGPTDRDGNNYVMKNNSLKMLAEALLEQNVASLRYDKRGVGASGSVDENDLRFEDYVDDLNAWVDHYSSDEHFSEIIICGHSEGALVGLLAAQQSPISKYISIAGAAMPAADILRAQLASQPIVLQVSEPILAKLEQGELYDNPPAMLNSLFRLSVQPYLISWFKYNPAQELTKLDVPILLVQGTTDLQVKADNLSTYAKANKLSQQYLVEGMNHILKEAPADVTANIATYSQEDLPLHPDLMKGIIDFIK